MKTEIFKPNETSAPNHLLIFISEIVSDRDQNIVGRRFRPIADEDMVGIFVKIFTGVCSMDAN